MPPVELALVNVWVKEVWPETKLAAGWSVNSPLLSISKTFALDFWSVSILAVPPVLLIAIEAFVVELSVCKPWASWTKFVAAKPPSVLELSAWRANGTDVM